MPISTPDETVSYSCLLYTSFAYLNDIGTWNININSQNTGCKNKTITVEQLLDIFEHHCTCFRTQNECFEDKRKEMIQLLKEHDPQATIDFN